MGLGRAEAVERVESIIRTVESDLMPVPIRELWVYGPLALGLDPIDRLNIYVTKDVLLPGDDAAREDEFVERTGIKGIGKTVRADWADRYPGNIRANDNGYAAPEKCLAAHLMRDDEPIHLEVCNTGFEDNVTQRLRGAQARQAYEEILDPRAVCLWIDGHHSPTAIEKLRGGDYVFPTLPVALEMLGLSSDEAASAADHLRSFNSAQHGATVRGDIV